MSRISCCRMCARRICPRSVARLKALDLATPNAGLITDIICLPRPRLLRSGQCALHSHRAGNRANASPISNASTIIGELKIKISRLHQCLRPSSRRPYRHSGRRQEGRGVSTSSSSAAPAPRMPASARSWGRASASTKSSMRSSAWSIPICNLRRDGERFLDTYRRVGMAPFKNIAYREATHAAY